MLQIIWLIIVIVNFFIGYKGKTKTPIAIISLLFTIVLVGGNSYNADYDGYKYFYDRQIYHDSMEIGYVLLSKVAYIVGMEYQYFVILLSTINLAVVVFILSRLKINMHLVICFNLLSLAFLDAVQIRSATSYVLFTLSLYFLANDQKIKSILSILIACAFQRVTLIFIPFIFINRKLFFSKKQKYIFLGEVIICLFLFVNRSPLNVLTNALVRFIPEEKTVYFHTQTRMGALYYFLFQFFCVLISFVCMQSINKRNDNSLINKYTEIVCYSCVYSTMFLPLVIINNNFLRIEKYSIWGLIILMSYLISNHNSERKINHDERIMLNNKYSITYPSFLILISFFFVLYFRIMQPISVIKDVFEYNILM